MNNSILEVTDNTFNKEVLENDKIVLVDFWAEWCSPCKMFAIVLEDLANHYEGKIKFVKVDVDKNTLTANKYKVKSLPTIILFKNGEIIDSISGSTTRTYVTSCITNALLDNKESLNGR